MFGKKKTEVQLTEKQIRELRSSMSSSERRRFDKEQKSLRKEHKQRENDAFWDGLLYGGLLIDDD